MNPIVSDYSSVESSTEESLFDPDSETNDEGTEETLFNESNYSSTSTGPRKQQPKPKVARREATLTDSKRPPVLTDRTNLTDGTNNGKGTSSSAAKGKSPSKTIWLPARKKKQDFLNSIEHQLRIPEGLNKDHQKKLRRFRFLTIAKAEKEFDDSSSPLWTSSLKVVQHESGVYYGGNNFTGKSKFGSAIDIKIRVKEQDLTFQKTVIVFEDIKSVLGDEYIESIISIGLPPLHYHPDRRSELVRTICLQVGEGILGCAYPNNAGNYFEKIMQLPTNSVAEAMCWSRFECCKDYATNGITHGASSAELEKLLPFIDFHKGIGASIHQLFSWSTAKHLLDKSDSAFMKAQPPFYPEKGTFLTKYLAKQRLGPKYNGFTDAVPYPPAAKFIDDNCLEDLKPLLGIDDVKNLDLAKINNAMKPIRRESNFEHHMSPDDDTLGRGTQDYLEWFLRNDENGTMVQTQTNNVEALGIYNPGWLDTHFETENGLQSGKSKFLLSRHGAKKLVIHPAHFRGFCRDAGMETRFDMTKDFLFHLDMTVANGYLPVLVAEEVRRNHQAYLMNLEYGEVYEHYGGGRDNKEEQRTSFHIARNCAFPRGWFDTSAGTGIMATANHLRIEKITFLYLREKLGPKLTHNLLVSQGLLLDGQQDLAPYEPGFRCTGVPAYKDIEYKGCIVKDGEEDSYICYVVQEDNPFKGLALCQRCFHNLRPVKDRYLEEQGRQEQLNERKKKRVQSQQKHRKNNFENVRANESKQNNDRFINPEKRSNRSSYMKNQYQTHLAKGGQPKRSGKTRYSTDPTGRHEARNVMKRGVLIMLRLYPDLLIYNNHVISLLDAIRNKFDGNEDIFYFQPEYTRCITAFLEKPVDEHGVVIKKAKKWQPKKAFKLTEDQEKFASDFHKRRTWKKLSPEIIEVIFDETKMVDVKNIADNTPFGNV